MVSYNKVEQEVITMSVQKYPRSVTIFKGEGRIFIVPLVRHIGGYSVDSEWFIKVKDMEDSKEI